MRYSLTTASLITLASYYAVLDKASACECGYTVNKTSDSQFALFTDYFEDDSFHKVRDDVTGRSTFPWHPWRTQHYITSARVTRGRYGTSKEIANVIPNTLVDGEWGGEPRFPLQGDAGLQLRVRHELEDNRVPIAEVSSPQTDMLYGSFRAAIKFTGVTGTCGAFFWYRNDTQEIDMEFLSKDPKALNLVVHSPESNKPSRSVKGSGALGVMEASDSSIAWLSPVDLPQDFHEYRFDWMPDRIDFYVDGSLVQTTTENIPDSPDHLMLSHWSNGDPNWSGGPPMENAFMTVGYVKAYFNTTASRDNFKAECHDLDPYAACVVPGVTSPPFSKGKKTQFYSMSHKDDIEGDTTFVGSGSNPRLDHDSAATFGFEMSSLIWYFVGAVSCVVYCLA